MTGGVLLAAWVAAGWPDANPSLSASGLCSACPWSAAPGSPPRRPQVASGPACHIGTVTFVLSARERGQALPSSLGPVCSVRRHLAGGGAVGRKGRGPLESAGFYPQVPGAALCARHGSILGSSCPGTLHKAGPAGVPGLRVRNGWSPKEKRRSFSREGGTDGVGAGRTRSVGHATSVVWLWPGGNSSERGKAGLCR